MFLLAVLVSLFHFEHLVGNVSLIDADIARKCEYARIASIGLVDSCCILGNHAYMWPVSLRTCTACQLGEA